MQYHIQLLWWIFGAFLLSETVILGAAASLIRDGQNKLSIALSVFGLLLLFPWWSSFRHNYSYYLLRIRQAKKLECEHEGLLHEGETLSRGEEVHCIKMPWSARKLPPRNGIPFLILMFGAVFILVALYSLSLCR